MRRSLIEGLAVALMPVVMSRSYTYCSRWTYIRPIGIKWDDSTIPYPTSHRPYPTGKRSIGFFLHVYQLTPILNGGKPRSTQMMTRSYICLKVGHGSFSCIWFFALHPLIYMTTSLYRYETRPEKCEFVFSHV